MHQAPALAACGLNDSSAFARWKFSGFGKPNPASQNEPYTLASSSAVFPFASYHTLTTALHQTARKTHGNIAVMTDPFRALAPGLMGELTERIAAQPLGLPALPLHIHEVLIALTFYSLIYHVVSPFLSSRLAAGIYPRLDRDTQVNWDIHIVSMLQSLVVNSLSLYLIFFDKERASWAPAAFWPERLFAYSESTGLLQSLALGYFLWDLYICVRHVGSSGWGMVVHALASSSMFTLGYRPFVHYYCPMFLLQELSTPFLNVHWFCDKLNLTGSIYQAINGACLIVVFFGCRLVWGAYGAASVSMDVYRATFTGYRPDSDALLRLFRLRGDLAMPSKLMASGTEIQRLPLWLGLTYLAANVSLVLLNVVWFSKMIAALRKRFDPPLGTKRKREGGTKKE